MSTQASQLDRKRKRVLMLTHRVPYPPDRGDRIRAYHLLQGLSTRFDVTLAAVADEVVADATHARLDALCREVLIADGKPMQRCRAAARALLTGQAITPAAMYDRSFADRLVARHTEHPFDIVLTYCTGMIGYTQKLYEATDHSHPFRHVLDLVDVDSLKWAGFAEQSRGPMAVVYRAEARRLRGVEAGDIVPFEAVTLLSETEADRYREHVTDRYTPTVVGNGVDLDRFEPAVQRANEPVIIFTGVLSYKPNVDAVAWFARQVMPRVLAAVPEARFDIVGKSPSSQVLALDELPGVRVVGPVEDTAESLRASAVAVAPMQIAPGVQNKVLEAMACGLPVVCSPSAASGIDALPGEHFIVSDDAVDCAAQVVRLLMNPGSRQQLGTAARQQVQQRYDWPSAIAPMMDLLDRRPADAWC